MFVATFEGNRVFRSTTIFCRFALRDVTEAFLPGTISRVECTSSPEEGVSMKRWFLLSLALIVVVVSLLVIRDHVTSTKPLANRSHLVRLPHSAYKYLFVVRLSLLLWLLLIICIKQISPFMILTAMSAIRSFHT